MAINYVQTDTSATFNIGCSGQTAGATTAGRNAAVGASAGATEVGADPGNNVTRAIFIFECTPAPNVTSWDAGNYVFPVNITTCDGGTTFVRADLCDYDLSTYATVVGNVTPTHSAGGTGVVTVTFNRGTAYSVQSQTNSRLFMVCTFQNTDPHGGSNVGITPDQTITTPITPPAATGWGRLLGQYRNRLVRIG